ncbi:hypothetical protein [Sphingobium sp. WCS2017Hpa-17]|uniref:hypothetical protein n=1 Tax=Sphingobium sp. WCS2017Hpa-17 TaxID=3073638 RepID=UPI00288BD9F6|nr:hypothetical protein [Sphingobium sp. WCS2017Hpa-17]
MLTNIYVIDYVVKDLDGAKDRLDRIFGTEPLWIHPDMMPGQDITAMYYQIPGNGEMSHAIGFFKEGGDSVRVERDRIFLIGVMCDDLPRTMEEISARGLTFVHEEPQHYAVGSSNTLGTLHGLEIFIARHVPGGDRQAREMMFTKDGHSDFGDDTQGGVFVGFSGIDLVVEDLDAAISTYSAVFGYPPVDTSARTGEPGVRSAHFKAPGDGRGMREFGLFATEGPPTPGSVAERLAGLLKAQGEGVFRLDFLVTDLEAMRTILADRGIALPSASYVLEAVNGADIRFVTEPA